MQGHTHEDIDQCFVALETHLKLASYNTLQEIFDNFANIYIEESKRPNNVNVTTCFQWTSFFESHVANMYYYNEPHAFKFMKYEDGKVCRNLQFSTNIFVIFQ